MSIKLLGEDKIEYALPLGTYIFEKFDQWFDLSFTKVSLSNLCIKPNQYFNLKEFSSFVKVKLIIDLEIGKFGYGGKSFFGPSKSIIFDISIADAKEIYEKIFFSGVYYHNLVNDTCPFSVQNVSFLAVKEDGSEIKIKGGPQNWLWFTLIFEV